MDENNKKYQVIIKLCCVIASFILWLYIFNVENPIRERKIVVPVQVLNEDVLSQSKLALVSEEKINVTLNIRGSASDIYSVKPEDFSLASDLSSYVVKKGDNKIPVEVKRYPQGISIVNDGNLWINISIDDLVVKTFPVKIILEGKTKEGAYALQPILDSKEVRVSGPAQKLNTVSNAVARRNINDATKDINDVLKLQAENTSGSIVNNVKVEPESVKVFIPIKKVKSVAISIKTQGSLENGGVIKSIVPMLEKIDIAGDEDILANLTSLDTEPINLNKLGGNDTAETRIVIPKGVILVNSNGIIKAKINYDKGIQKEFNIDIQTRNIGDNYTVDLSNGKTTVTVSGLESVLSNLKPESIDCFVDLSNLAEGTHTVPVTINTPQGISKVSQNPVSVTVTIKKKQIGG